MTVREFLAAERARSEQELARLGDSQDPGSQARRQPLERRIALFGRLIAQDDAQPISPAEFPQWIDELEQSQQLTRAEGMEWRQRWESS